MKSTPVYALPLVALALTLPVHSVAAQDGPNTGPAPDRPERLADNVGDDFHNRETDRGQIVVTGALGITDLDVLAGVSVVDGLDLQRNLDGQIGEVIDDLAGVSTTGFTPGASRPILRGLDGERVRVLIDGIGTLDVSNTSADHAVSIDPLTVERIEVLRGPAVLLYGSQAIGGAVNVIDTRIPRRVPDEPIHIDALAGYDSVNDQYRVAGSVDVPLGGGFVFHVDGSYLEAGDLEVPGFVLADGLRADVLAEAAEKEAEMEFDEAEELRELADTRGTLPNSFVETSSLNAGLAFFSGNSTFGFSVGWFDSLYGLPERPGAEHHHEDDGGAGAGAGGEEEEENVTIDLEQIRVDARADIDTGEGLVGRMLARIGYIDYEHIEFEGPEVGTVYTTEAVEGRLEFIQNPLGNLRGSFGAQFFIRDFSAVGEEAFVLPNTTEQFGFFTLQELTFGPFQLEGSARYEATQVESQPLGAARDFDVLSGALGLSYQTGGLRFGINASRVGRAPAGEELFANGPHIATQQFEVGDVNLDVERAWGVEGYVRGNIGPATVSFSIFQNWFDNFIYLNNTGINVDEEGDVIAPGDDEEGLPLFVYLQQDADYFGIEGSVEVPLFETDDFGIVAEARGEYVDAQLADGSSVPRIPPLSLLGALSFQTASLDIRGEVEWFAEQDDVPAFESTTESFAFVNASIAWRPFRGNTNVTLLAQVENIFDQEGRRATSFTRDFVPLPGRNFSASVRFSY